MKVMELFEQGEEIDIQDMIITQYELDQITKEQAWAEIKRVTHPDELFFWHMELTSAETMKSDEDVAGQHHLAMQPGVRNRKH